MNLQVFLASLAGTGAEFLETAVIAYALARTGFVRESIIGTLLGNLLVALPAYFAWPWLARIPIHLFQCMVGILLLWLGGLWLVKSVYRKRHKQRPGWVDYPLGAFPAGGESDGTRFSPFKTLVMTKSAVIEAFEICMIVSALAVASGAWGSALTGMAVALVGTGCLVPVLKGKLQHVPEVDFKLWTGALLSVLGLWWLYEGAANWP
jgi:Ca2+/H+ antiporter, TMEM165/GDT1 family